MKFNIVKSEAIKNYICEKILVGDTDLIEKTIKSFYISKQTVYRYLNKLINNKIIVKKGKFYSLTEKSKNFRYENNGLYEDEIFKNDLRTYIDNLPQNVQNIWYYAFTEMFNNAIDHSDSKYIAVRICQNYICTIITIIDSGVGIFNKIKDHFSYTNIDDAISELFKGKLTTDTENHSGEGIFFTSRILDGFIAMSSGKIFTHDNDSDSTTNIEDIDVLKKYKDDIGTTIYMRLANKSNKILKEVFDMFSDSDGGFNKTSVPIKNIFEYGYPVSRSQAKRLYNRFDEFKTIELDFSGVSEIGQGFAHELFYVFKNAHPEIELVVKNENSAIRDMINHIKNTI